MVFFFDFRANESYGQVMFGWLVVKLHFVVSHFIPKLQINYSNNK